MSEGTIGSIQSAPVTSTYAAFVLSDLIEITVDQVGGSAKVQLSYCGRFAWQGYGKQ